MAWHNNSSGKNSTSKPSKTLAPNDNGARFEHNDLHAPFAKAVNEAYWHRVDKWESGNVRAPGDGEPQSRGEWVNAFLNTLLSICANYGYSVDPSNEQQLRDELFDYIKSVSF